VDLWSALFLAAALLAAALVLVESLRRPILSRMALRNALRRPKQTATVIAGLMVGTAIISSALVAGDSAAGAIRGYVYQSLGTVDESVAIQAYPFFPQTVYNEFLADPAIRDGFDGVSAHVVWQGALEDQRTAQFEPNVAVVGYDTQRDGAFGQYQLLGGGGTSGDQLQAGQAIATKHLADQLGLQPGDQVQLSFVQPIDPLLPRIYFTNGTVTGADPSLVVPVLPNPTPNVPGAPLSQVHIIPVEKAATRLTVILAWDPALAPMLPPTIDLAAHLTAPDGTRRDVVGHPVGNDPRPLLLNVTSAPDATLPVGNWTIANIEHNPVFYYQPGRFWNADPNDAKEKIAPGPNNPVGVVWMGLSKRHYGIHGTPDPSLIGHAESYGCIRLTNWDAADLARMVRRGTPAILKD